MVPIDLGKYPEDWKTRAKAVKEAAGWRCEECGIGHMEDGTMGSCLTVHHPDRDPANDDARLVALCARCHFKRTAICAARIGIKTRLSYSEGV